MCIIQLQQLNANMIQCDPVNVHTFMTITKSSNSSAPMHSAARKILRPTWHQPFCSSDLCRNRSLSWFTLFPLGTSDTAGSHSEVESPPLCIIMCIPFTVSCSFRLHMWEEADLLAVSAVWLFGLVPLGVTWLGRFLQICHCADKMNDGFWRCLPKTHVVSYKSQRLLSEGKKIGKWFVKLWCLHLFTSWMWTHYDDFR